MLGAASEGGLENPVPLEEADDEVDDAALLDDADEADEELEAPEAEVEADEEVGDFEGDEDEEGGVADAMDIDGRGGMAEEDHYGHGEARLSGANGADAIVV